MKKRKKKDELSDDIKEYIRKLVKETPQPYINYELLYKVRRLANLICLYAEFKKNNKQNIEILEEKFKSYEGFLDKQYWNLFDLLLIMLDIGGGKAHTIEEAVALLENRTFDD